MNEVPNNNMNPTTDGNVVPNDGVQPEVVSNPEAAVPVQPEAAAPVYEEVAPQFQEVVLPEKQVRTDSYFDGGLLELIGWRILAGLITVVTFSIGRPWAQCMLYAYEYNHTVYNGKRLKFEGKGGDLFVNYFKWFFLAIIT